MTFPIPSLGVLTPGGMNVLPVPGPAKIILACCGYMAGLGSPQAWECPGCGNTLQP